MYYILTNHCKHDQGFFIKPTYEFLAGWKYVILGPGVAIRVQDALMPIDNRNKVDRPPERWMVPVGHLS